jgi:hypothetical protein
MIDYNNLPNIDNNISIFYAIGSATWQTWVKPKGCKFVYVFVIGGGGGGGGGSSGTGVGRTGGGGGGSSGINKGIFMANTLPDTLYVNVGYGGAGGVPNGNGSVGSFSFVSVLPNSTSINVLLRSNSTSTPLGGNTSGTVGITGGAVDATQQILAYNGVTLFSLGNNGTSGGSSAGGNGTAVGINNFLFGGAGGGGSSAANANGTGGNVNFSGVLPNLSGGAAGGTNNGTTGYYGLEPNKTNIMRNAFIFSGGAGGGANGVGVGGNGGDGAYGCGGGGGGAGTTGGSGGRGGDGLVIIISW